KNRVLPSIRTATATPPAPLSGRIGRTFSVTICSMLVSACAPTGPNARAITVAKMSRMGPPIFARESVATRLGPCTRPRQDQDRLQQEQDERNMTIAPQPAIFRAAEVAVGQCVKQASWASASLMFQMPVIGDEHLPSR